MNLDEPFVASDLDIMLNHLRAYFPSEWPLLSPGTRNARRYYLPSCQIVIEPSQSEPNIAHIERLHESRHHEDFLALWEVFNLRVNTYVENFNFLMSGGCKGGVPFGGDERKWIGSLNDVFEALALWELKESTESLKNNEAKPYRDWLAEATKHIGYEFVYILQQFCYALRHYAMTRGAGLDVVINGYLSNIDPVLLLTSDDADTDVPRIQLGQPASKLHRLFDLRNYLFPRISDYPRNAMMVVTGPDEFEVKVLESCEKYYSKWESYLHCYQTINAKMQEVASSESRNIPVELLFNPIQLLKRQLRIVQKIYDWNKVVDKGSDMESKLADAKEGIDEIARAVPIIGPDGSLRFSISDQDYLKELLIHAAITHIREWKEGSLRNQESLRCPFHSYVFKELNDSQLNEKCKKLRCLFPQILEILKSHMNL